MAIEVLAYNSYDGKLYLGGSFTVLSSACLGIAFFDDTENKV